MAFDSDFLKDDSAPGHFDFSQEQNKTVPVSNQTVSSIDLYGHSF